MKFLPGINSVLPCWRLFASVIVFAALAAATAAFAQEASPNAPLCPPGLGPPNTPTTYGGLLEIILDIQIDPQYLGSLDCHGRESECLAKNPGVAYDAANYLKRLKDTYDRYPKQLQPDSLVALFRPLLQKRLVPYFAMCPGRGVQVFSPLPILEGSESNKNSGIRGKALTNIDTLIITVRVDIFDDTKPRIAVLTYRQLRPGNALGYGDTHLTVRAIPLDIGEDELTKILASYANKAVPWVTRVQLAP